MDGIRQARVWIQLSDLSLELWEKDKILHTIEAVGKPFFLDDWTAASARLGFARVCVLIDMHHTICPGVKVLINDEVIWLEFIYEDLLEIYYICGRIANDSKTSECLNVSKQQREKPIYGLWIRASRVPVNNQGSGGVGWGVYGPYTARGSVRRCLNVAEKN